MEQIVVNYKIKCVHPMPLIVILITNMETNTGPKLNTGYSTWGNAITKVTTPAINNGQDVIVCIKLN